MTKKTIFSQPISPKDLKKLALQYAHDELDPRVNHVVNELLMENYPSKKCVISKRQIENKLRAWHDSDYYNFTSFDSGSTDSDQKQPVIQTIDVILSRTTLDSVKKAFEHVGWVIALDVPGFNENYPERLEFNVHQSSSI